MCVPLTASKKRCSSYFRERRCSAPFPVSLALVESPLLQSPAPATISDHAVRKFTKMLYCAISDLDLHSKVLWGANIAQHPPTVRYSDVIESERGVWLWLRTIDTYGFSFVEGVPPTPEATEALSERIGIIRETQCESTSYLKTYLINESNHQTANFGISPRI